MVDLSKEEATAKFVSLKKNVGSRVSQLGLGAQRAQVVNVLDISGSMSGLFHNGTVQQTCERALAVGIQFDDDGSIPVYPFGKNSHPPVDLQEDGFYQYVDREITSRFPLEGNTLYAGPIRRIIDDHFPGAVNIIPGKKGGFFKSSTPDALVIDRLVGPVQDPVFVIFVTDGDNNDKAAAAELIKAASVLPMFIQFVAIGRASFSFLEKLDDMPGRFVDNAGLFKVPNIESVSDDDFLAGVLNEFPDWLKEARGKSLIM